MPYEIKIKKAVLKNLRKLPTNVQDRFENLSQVLKLSGTAGAHIFRILANWVKTNIIVI
jgi:mRNA-degrading endonuclease RelE of RelBE toxin-antitoxin system